MCAIFFIYIYIGFGSFYYRVFTEYNVKARCKGDANEYFGQIKFY